MRAIEVKLREGMQRNGISPEVQEQIILSITSFALYGFPESHAASFALIAYASAYLKCHYLAAFTAALLNNQPMGFYHPSTIVKDAQRHGLKVKPVDITSSDWLCTLEAEANATLWDKAEWQSGSSSTGVSDREDGAKSSAEYFEGARLQPGHKKVEQDSTLAAEETRISANSEVPQLCGTPEGVPFQIEAQMENGFAPCESISLQASAVHSTSFALRMGFRYAKGLREESAQAIASERVKRPFESIADLACRVPELRRNELVLLASIGALNSIGHQSAESASATLSSLGGAALQRCNEELSKSVALAAERIASPKALKRNILTGSDCRPEGLLHPSAHNIRLLSNVCIAAMLCGK